VDFRKKMIGFLARRGFNYDTISAVIPKLWNELHGETDTEPREV
jgi:SOS response regulatory protein OraA/RecX